MAHWIGNIPKMPGYYWYRDNDFDKNLSILRVDEDGVVWKGRERSPVGSSFAEIEVIKQYFSGDWWSEPILPPPVNEKVMEIS